MRKKPWARPELEATSFFVKSPEENRGKWSELFGNNNPINIELGCGKGGFISKLAVKNPDINYLAIDIKDEMLILAKRKIEKEYEDNNLQASNIKLMAYEIMIIDRILGEGDVVDRIYINFCNPWPKNRHKARRLTSINQLTKYKNFLKKDGEIWFKTDDDPLFADALECFQECGFTTKYITYDLHNSGFTESIPTEHEMMFTDMGLKTKFIIATI